jgi:hypothetical protein
MTKNQNVENVLDDLNHSTPVWMYKYPPLLTLISPAIPGVFELTGLTVPISIPPVGPCGPAPDVIIVPVDVVAKITSNESVEV